MGGRAAKGGRKRRAEAAGGSAEWQRGVKARAGTAAAGGRGRKRGWQRGWQRGVKARGGRQRRPAAADRSASRGVGGVPPGYGAGLNEKPSVAGWGHRGHIGETPPASAGSIIVRAGQ